MRKQKLLSKEKKKTGKKSFWVRPWLENRQWTSAFGNIFTNYG